MCILHTLIVDDKNKNKNQTKINVYFSGMTITEYVNERYNFSLKFGCARLNKVCLAYTRARALTLSFFQVSQLLASL